MSYGPEEPSAYEFFAVAILIVFTIWAVTVFYTGGFQ